MRGQFKIIIPVCNSCCTLFKLLEHLRQDPSVALEDVIVVDDASTDGTASALARHFPEVVRLNGTGSLYWCGGIRMGMDFALTTNAPFIFWLNHDCLPDPGSFSKLLEVLEDPAVGCVSGFCRLAGDYPHNPGFKSFRPIHLPKGAKLVEADGLNGNFVGFRTDAVRKIGLPDAINFPHHGDTPYTLRFSRAGWRTLILTEARANLDHELHRLLPTFWRVALSKQTLGLWFQWHFTSIKSLWHWKYRWKRMFWFRGTLAVVAYPISQAITAGSIIAGVIARSLVNKEKLLLWFLRGRDESYPSDVLRKELGLQK